MKKLVAALLVLTMVLALTGSAMASCDFELHQYVNFTKNSYAYTEPKSSKKTNDPATIVRRGSIGAVEGVSGDYVLVRLSRYKYTGIEGEDWNFYCPVADAYCWAAWFKADTLKLNGKGIVPSQKTGDVLITYSNGGVGLSKAEAGATVVDLCCYDHIKATSKVWLHKTYSLSKNYGKALKKNQKVKYRHIVGYDDRGMPFYGVRYDGKCLWVSSAYSKRVK